MRAYRSGIEAGRDCEVTGDGTLSIRVGANEVARFGPGAWLEVRRVGVPLRDSWPPEDFERLMASLGERLVVGYGLDFRYSKEPFLDPAVNDLNAFVDAVLVREGGVAGMDSEHRRWISAAVESVFGVVAP